MTTLVGLACTMVLARVLTLDEYGTYSQGNLIISIATSVTVLGLTDASNYFFNHPDYGKPFISNIYALQVVLGLLAAAAIVLGRGFLAGYFNNAEIATIAIYVAFRPFINNVLATLQVLIVSLGMARLIAIRNLVVSVAKIVAVCIVALVSRSIITIFVVYLLVDIVNAAWFFAIYVRQCGLPRMSDISFSAAKKILLFSIPMALSVLMGTLSREMAKLVTSAFESTAQYAIFANCSAQLPLDFISSAFLTVIMPILTKRISSNQLSDARMIYKDFIQIGYLLVWPLAGCLFLLSQESVLILYGEKYVTGTPIFALFLVTYGTTFLGSTLVMAASGHTKQLMIIGVVATVCNAAGCLALHGVVGFLGPAIASVVVTLGMSLVIAYGSCRILEGGIGDLLSPKLALGVLAELVCIGALLYPLKQWLGSMAASALVVALVIGILFIGLFYALNFKRVVRLLRAINGFG